MKSLKERASAVGYTRLSQQSETSINRQKRHIREYASDHDLELLEIYNDGERSSGFDADRTEYQHVREHIRTGDIDAVIVNDTRRLARDVDQVMRLVPDFRDTGVELHTYQDGPIDLSDPVRAAIEIVTAASAHEDKQKEIKRSIEAVDERLADPEVDHGPPRLGMTYNEAGTRQVPGDDIDLVCAGLWERAAGASYPQIEERVGIDDSTMHRIWHNKEWYFERLRE